MREAYRQQKTSLYTTLENKKKRLALFLIYTGKELPQYNLVYEKMGAAIQLLVKKTEEGSIL